jgi:hypothetical protein
MKNNQKGFGAVEGMLLVIIVLLVGFIGYYVYHTSNKANSSYNNAASSSSAASTIKPIDRSSDEALIVKAVKAKFPDAPYLQVTVSEYKDQFARGSAGGEGSGFAFVAKKQNGTWNVIASGQQQPGKAEGQKYGMPSGWYSTDY